MCLSVKTAQVMHFSLGLGLSLDCEMGLNVLILYAYIPSHIFYEYQYMVMHGLCSILKNISTSFPFMEMY